MSTSVSPSLFIDFSRLPPPNVIEDIAYEDILARYKSQVFAKNPDLERALKLEQSPTNVILEVESYGEMLVRSRINSAGRALMLPFSIGTDLDNLGAFFGVSRLAIVDNPRAYPAFAQDWESDARFRRRIQLAPEAYSNAGTEGGYIFHALSSAPTLRDASAIRLNDRGLVQITLMNSGADPTPTADQLSAVKARFNLDSVRPLTDTVYVTSARVIQATISGTITLYPGPDQTLVINDIKAGIAKVRDRISLLGRDLTRSAIIAALNQEGVENVTLDTPTADITCDQTQCVLLSQGSNLTINPTRTE